MDAFRDAWDETMVITSAALSRPELQHWAIIQSLALQIITTHIMTAHLLPPSLRIFSQTQYEAAIAALEFVGTRVQVTITEQ